MSDLAAPVWLQEGTQWQQLWDIQPGLREGTGHWQEEAVLGGCTGDLPPAGNPNLAIPTKSEENSSFSLALMGN